MSNPISLVIVVRNAQENLRKLIKRHRPMVKEIIVVDQGSDDGTLEVARELADLVVKRTKKGFCEPDRQYAVDLANQPYVLLLDDDEEVSDDLEKLLPELLKGPGDIFWLRRVNYIDGVDIEEVLINDYQCRLWKKGSVRWSGVMHQFPEGANNTKVYYIEANLNHYRTFEGMKKSNRRREQVAQDKSQVKMQDAFIRRVETLLEKKGVLANAR